MLLLAAALALSTASSIGRADDVTAASELRRRGDEAMDAGRAAEALQAYLEAAALEPGPALAYNIGRARLATGDFAGALGSFEQFQRDAPEELRARTHRLPEIMRDLEGKVARVEIAGAPRGARVLVRGVEVGVLPITVRVNAGRAEIRVESVGYEPHVQAVDLRGAEAARIEIALALAPNAGRLAIHALPAGAGVTIDGRGRGATPLALDLPPGAHRIVVSAPSYRPRRFAIDLAKGEQRRVDITLEREPTPLLKSPWFWGGVGVLVAGAAATTFALTQERSADEGTLGTFRVP